MDRENFLKLFCALIGYQRMYLDLRDDDLSDTSFKTVISFENKSKFKEIPFRFINEENRNEVSEIDLHNIKGVDIGSEKISFYGYHHDRFDTYIKIDELLENKNINIFYDFLNCFILRTKKISIQ